MNAITIGLIIMFIGVVIAIVLGMAMASDPGIIKVIKKCLADQIAEIKRLSYDEIKKKVEKHESEIIEFENRQFIRKLILTEIDCTGAKYAADPYMLLKVQVIISSKDQKHSEYEFISKKQSTREGLYHKGKK